MNEASKQTGMDATHTQTAKEGKYTSYPVTPPENWALDHFEQYDVLVFENGEKLYKRFWGEQRQHTQQRTTTNNNMFV